MEQWREGEVGEQGGAHTHTHLSGQTGLFYSTGSGIYKTIKSILTGDVKKTRI